MRRVLDASTGALTIAGSLCGVPFVGAAAVIVEDIVKTCDEVRAHKKKAKQLSHKCVQLLNTLNDQASKVDGSELQQIMDEIVPVLETIQTRTRRWSKYNAVTTFLKNANMKDGLDRCEAELNTAMNLFHINSTVVLHSTQREMLETMRSNKAEMQELLLQALTNKSETQQIVELQNAGEHVAERFMEAGQKELMFLRESRVVVDDGETPSTSSAPFQPRDSQRYLQYQRGLINLHRETGIPPTVKIMDGEVTKIGELAVAGGTYSDIWVGMWFEEEKVALKALRNIRASDPRAKKRFENEIKLWADLKNDQILPFYGIVTDLGQHIHMVSPWQNNGNVLDYVKAHPSADRLRLILGAAKGLEYLHARKIIHGNMKCANILVSRKGVACICDFGMSKLIEEVTEKSASATLTTGGSARWLAPELIEGKVASPTMEADVYSYAMAILELLTGKHPFADYKRDAQVIHGIVVLKKTPSRPNGAVCPWLSDELWSLMQKCWLKDAHSRPSMAVATALVMEIELTTQRAGLI
ncbi:TKL/TKL-ccin protein kinase [Crassisporium funariophilum]|nr:TKL/TKL-ccin protein kinase [Crassisporium funariophilum]